MKGVGSHSNDWAYYPSPSSNLSAFAAPFSVNRFSPNDVVSALPFPDSAESALQPRSYGYDFFSNPIRELDSAPPPSKPYGYSVVDSSSSVRLPQFKSLGLATMDSFSYDQCSSNNGGEPSHVDSQFYYSSYVPSPIHDPAPSVVPNNWPALSSGFASLDGSTIADFAKNSPEVGFIGPSAGLWNQFAELNHGKGMHVGVGTSFSANQTNVAGSAVEERMNQGGQEGTDSVNSKVAQTTGWEKQSIPAASADHLDSKSCLWGSFKPTPVEVSGISVMGSTLLPLETHGEAPAKAGDSGNLSRVSSYDKFSRQRCDRPLRVDTTSSSPIPGLVMDLKMNNDPTDGDLGNNNLYKVMEADQGLSSGTSGGFDLSHLRLHLERNEPFSSNNGMDKIDPRNVVDYIFKETNGVQDSHKTEKFSGYVIQEPQNCLLDTDNNVKRSSKISNNNHDLNDFVHQEDIDLRKIPALNFKYPNCNSYNATRNTSFQSEPSCNSEVKYLNGVTEVKEKNVPPVKPIHHRDSRTSWIDHSLVDENKLLYHKPETDGANAGNNMNETDVSAGSNVNDDLKCGISQIPENTLSSTTVVDATKSLEKSAEKVLSPKLNVQMLVDTMHNMSELLLFHCMNDACELKEQDFNVLKVVISNLNACSLKNAERITRLQEFPSPHPGTSRHARESCKLQQNASFVKHQVTQLVPEIPKVELENPLVEEAKNLHIKSGKLVQQLSSSISPRGDAEMKKEDEMTKALKKILSENLHDDDDDDDEVESQTSVLYKNLWLEAEASLCSIHYKARYNQMKNEIKRLKQKDVGDQSNISQSFATHIDADANAKNMPGSKSSIDMNKPNPLTPEGNTSQNLDSLVQNSNLSSTKKDVGNGEASVLARFHILRTRGDNSPSKGKEVQTHINFSQESPLLSKMKVDDHEASVMARFHILKSRVEDLSSSSKDTLLDGFADKGMDNTILDAKASVVESLDVHVNPSIVHLSSYSAVDKSIPKELQLDLEESEEIQPCENHKFDYNNQHPADGLASEWEHVSRLEGC
ncbi:hypothetical protein AAHE18_10G133300 [Arachis hypogaea]